MAASGRHRLTRKRFTAGVVALAAVGGAVAYTVASPAEHASAAGGCAPYESIRMGKYWINNNTWASKPKHEVMVWLAKDGGAGAAGVARTRGPVTVIAPRSRRATRALSATRWGPPARWASS